MNFLQRLGAKALGFNVLNGGNNLSWKINTAGEWIYDEGSTAYIDQGYKALPNVYSIIHSIASKCSIIPFEIFTKKDNTKYQKYKASIISANTTKDYANTIKLKHEALTKVENTEIEKLLHNPNSYQSYEQLMWEIYGYKLLTGNSILYGISLADGGKPKELHSIPSPLVDMVVKGSPFAPEFEYKVSYLEHMLPGSDIYHFKYWNPISSYSMTSQQFWGISPLKSCERLLGRYKDADITQGFQFKNMGPAGMISGGSTNPDTNLTEEQAVAVQDRFDQQHQGTYKAGSILVTPSNLKWTAFGLSPVDLNILASKEDMSIELSNVFHYPIALLSSKNSTENNMIEARKALITDCVIPLAESIKWELQKAMLPKFGDQYVIEFDYTIFSEMQEDLNKLAETYARMDWITDNEKRAGTGYDRYEDPAADVIYKNPNLVPIQDLSMGVPDIDETLLNE